MEVLHHLIFMLRKGDYMCKLDLNDACFSVPLSKDSRKMEQFQLSGNLYEFLCLCFGLGPASRVFTKLLKFPTSILRRLNIRTIIYLDDMLHLGKTFDNFLTSKGTVILLLSDLVYVINLKKSVLIATQKIDFLGLIVNSIKLILSLAKKHQSCREIHKALQVSILEFTTDRTFVINCTGNSS